MTSSKPTLIVFSGAMHASPIERLVGGARAEAALDTLDRGRASGAFAGALLVTDDAELAARVPPGVEVDRDAAEFDFGTRLRQVVAAHQIERPFYVGGGSIPLLEAADLAWLAERLAGEDRLVISNNYYSADFIGWTPGAAIEQLAAIPSDNKLPQLLHLEAGLPSWAMERSLASQFDIDTAGDLAIVKLYGANGPRLRAYLDRLDLDVSRYRRAMAFFVQPAMVLIAGRVGSAVWQHLEHETACRIRLFSEERGMQADEREQSGKVRSLLGFYHELAGAEGLFRALAQLGDAVFLDSRVLLAHFRLTPSAADRFLSDLGRWQEVGDPFLRELTRAAVEAPVPVVLGGHSLVAGGIMALVQAAWDEHDRATQA